MKNIEEIREKLGPDYRVEEKDGVITVCDIWDGVEFAIADCNGIIYKIDRFETSPMKKIWFSHGRFLFPEKCKPSTESAYVEQLKAKAKELYGEIKDGDRFDISMLEEDPKDFRMFYDNPIFTYYKKDDSLWAGNYPIYKQGKWAKKVERVKVEGTWNEYNDDHLTVRFKFEYKGSHPNPVELSAHLAKCLEDYLNKS